MSTLIEVCFTKCQKLIQGFITEAPLCSAIYTKHICTQTKDLFRAVTSSSATVSVHAKRTEDSDYLAQEEPGVRTTIVKNHKEVEQRAKCDGDCRRKSTFAGGGLQGISSVVGGYIFGYEGSTAVYGKVTVI